MYGSLLPFAVPFTCRYQRKNSIMDPEATPAGTMHSDGKDYAQALLTRGHPFFNETAQLVLHRLQVFSNAFTYTISQSPCFALDSPPTSHGYSYSYAAAPSSLLALPHRSLSTVSNFGYKVRCETLLTLYLRL
jgi:hypothetical protein